MSEVTLLHGDCLQLMPTLPENSIDAIVTDPPYGLSFMGAGWDHAVPDAPYWEAALRVAKPGAHMLAFGSTRLHHRLMVAIEDAGWEIRDVLMWVYGSGFPKSHNVSKALDKMAGAEREVVGERPRRGDKKVYPRNSKGSVLGSTLHQDKLNSITAPATDAARQWDGWGTALKPAWEPIILARKPLAGTVAANVLRYGTGALNIDGCRVEGESTLRTNGKTAFWGDGSMNSLKGGSTQGRFPANFVHDGSDEVLGLFPETKSGNLSPHHKLKASDNRSMSGANQERNPRNEFGGDSGSAARFFYCAKASKKDRDEGLDISNHHPTVKPTTLLRYLIRLITPPGGTVLDPFMGSGSTGKAAMFEGAQFVGIELDAEYVAIAQARIDHALAQRPVIK